MSLRIENVVFFPKKNDFLIVRGGRFRSGSFMEGGEPVVKLEGFSKYYFDPCTCAIYSRKGRRTFEALKKRTEGARDYFILYLNGNQKKVFLWEILRDNMRNLEEFFSNDSKETLRPDMKSKHSKHVQ